MTRSDVEIIADRTAYDGYFKLREYTLRHALFDGGTSSEMTREVFERGHAVAVLPYDPVSDTVLLIEQFRIGAYVAGEHAWLGEVVAGIIDSGQTAEEVGRRELQDRLK